MRILFPLPIFLIACIGKDPAPGQLETCEITPVDGGGVHTDGMYIRDELDRRVQLRGINTGGRSKFAPFAPFDFAEGEYEHELDIYLDRTVEWGLNVLRVPFSWDALEPEQGVYDEAYLQRYDTLLDHAADRGLRTIVDFHQDIYSERYCGDGFPLWSSTGGDEPHHDCERWFSAYLGDAELQQAFDEFWSNETGVMTAFEQMWAMMSARHADRPGVIGYEIINEPGWGSMNMATWERTVLPPFYAKMAAIVQEQDPDALVFFDGTGLDAVTGTSNLDLPEGDNLVFAPHFYDVSVFAGGEASLEVEEGIAAWAAKGTEWNVPVLVGEFGIQPDKEGAQAYAEANWTALDNHLLHGTWWEYSAAVEWWNHENLSVVDADGTERPTLIEPLIRPTAEAIAGEDLVWEFDGTTSALHLSFTPLAEGISEVRLPARRFGNEPGITGSGACIDLQGERLLIQPDGTGEVVIEVVAQ